MSELNVGLLRASALLTLVLDREGRILLWNHACSELTGYSFEEVQGKYVWDLLVAPEDAEHARAAYHRLLVGEVLPRVEGYLVTKSGERRWIGWSHDVTRRPDGTVEFLSAIGMDRSDAKRAEEALRVSEARFAGIVSIAADAIISIDDRQRIVIFNEGAERIFGWARDEILGKPLGILIPERFQQSHRKHVHIFAQEEAPFARKMGEHRPAIFGLRKNGEEFPADAAISKLHVDGVRLYTVVLRDITAQKLVERDQRFLSEVGAALATSLDYGETLTRIAELSVRYLADWCIIDLLQEDGTIRRWKVIHADPGKANLAERLEHLPLDSTKLHLASAALATKRTTVVSDLTDGHLESIAQSDEHLQLLRELGPTSYVGLPLQAHDRLLGAMVLVRSDSSRPYRENEVRLGEDLAYRAAHSIDSARLYRLSQQAIRTRDEVLGIVAHDLRNPLSTAMLAARTLLLRERDEERRESAPNLAEIIARSLDGANRLIQDLLDVSRMEGGRLTIEPAPLSSEGLVMEAIEAFAPIASTASLELETDIRRLLPPVLADSGRVAQVFSNLVGNALKFTPAGGRIQIGAERRAGEVCFWVRDTGPGISKRNAQHLFERFWQAGRADRRGAGLGLSIAKGIVDAHGGRIWVESTPGVGSTFYFTVPIATGPEDRPAEPFPAAQPA